MPLPLIVVVVLLVGGLVVWQRLRVGQALAQNQDKAFGAVASRMGMRVEEGDPNTNLLYFMEKMGNYERELRATGQPYAHVAQFKAVDSVKSAERIVYRSITHSYGCFLKLRLRQPVAPFEAVLRNPNQYLTSPQDLADRGELGEVPSGNPQIDGQFVIRATEPRTAAVIVPALQILSQQLFVHLAGDGDELWMNITRMGLPYFAGAAEEYMLALETAACGLEGLALPARIGAPLAAPAGGTLAG